ncbi:MAG: hypothetical protein ACI906_002040 [Candidatus Latescibacterota bacterium]|jgi:hypothetical protein
MLKKKGSTNAIKRRWRRSRRNRRCLSRYIREHLNHFLVLYLRELYAFSAIKALATTLPSIVLGFEIGSDARLLLQ